MRCIDADALIHELNNSHYPGAPYVDAGISIAIGKVCDAPTIEPERKKGKWILVTDNNGQHFICDHCGEWRYHQNQKFCGECGADMREGRTTMIIEARCNDCGKRIGYISIQGDTEGLEDIKYVMKVTYMGTRFAILCDDCRDGWIDLEGEHKC